MDTLESLETDWEILRKREQALKQLIADLSEQIRKAVTEGNQVLVNHLADRLDISKLEIKELSPLLDEMHIDLTLMRRRKNT